MCIVRFIALLLVIIGALNWGLWGVFQYDLVADFLKGNTSMWARLVYSVIGLAGLYSLTFFFNKGIYSSHHSGCCKEEHKD